MSPRACKMLSLQPGIARIHCMEDSSCKCSLAKWFGSSEVSSLLDAVRYQSRLSSLES